MTEKISERTIGNMIFGLGVAVGLIILYTILKDLGVHPIRIWIVFPLVLKLSYVFLGLIMGYLLAKAYKGSPSAVLFSSALVIILGYSTIVYPDHPRFAFLIAGIFFAIPSFLFSYNERSPNKIIDYSLFWTPLFYLWAYPVVVYQPSLISILTADSTMSILLPVLYFLWVVPIALLLTKYRKVEGNEKWAIEKFDEIMSPPIKIALIGPSESGKTVFLVSLLEGAQTPLDPIRAASYHGDPEAVKHIEESRYRLITKDEGKDLPNWPQRTIGHYSIGFKFVFKGKLFKKITTLACPDIAGEVMFPHDRLTIFRRETLSEEEEKIRGIIEEIKKTTDNADAYIFLLDPDRVNDVWFSQNYINTLIHLVEKRQNDKPVLFIVTKYDPLKSIDTNKNAEAYAEEKFRNIISQAKNTWIGRVDYITMHIQTEERSDELKPLYPFSPKGEGDVLEWIKQLK